MTKKPRILRAPIRSGHWAAGRPCNTNAFADIEVAALRAGMHVSAARLLALLAADVAKGYDWKIPQLAQSLTMHCRVEHAAQFPNGKWAVLYRRYGGRAYYMASDCDDAMHWATNSNECAVQP